MKLTALGREALKNEVREAAAKDKYFTTTSAFYYLAGACEELPIADAVSIVGELRKEKPNPFAD